MTVSATRRASSNPVWPTVVGMVAVLCLFCAPLFVGLGNSDLGSDEAVYSYAVDRILETGEWLTPRLIPYDGPFLEKPPLKFWALAGAMRVGLLPRNEFGLRFLDALFGATAFVYVFWLGRRLAGPLCGVVAVLVLFTQGQLLFEHGLRSNNMDAALFLAYCGGIYHFARWVEDAAGSRRVTHAFAVAAYVTFGFMTKFVAVLFLPLICVAAFAWRSDSSARLRSGWRDCMMDPQRQAAETHVYPTYEQLLDHAPYYYLRPVGPWIEHGGSPKNDELLDRLYSSGRQALMLLHSEDYERFERQIARGEVVVPRPVQGLAPAGGIVLLAPEPFEVCATASIAAGGNDVTGFLGPLDAQ